MRICRALILCTAAALVPACSTVPETISTPVPGPDIRDVQANAQAHRGEMVRWGGTISGVKNLEAGTEITVVARSLTRRGEPLGQDPSSGRFIVAVNRFLDPEEYESGRRITAVGMIAGVRPSKIGEYVYDYPVVKATDVYLWKEYVRHDPYPYPPWPRYWGPYYRPYHWPIHHYHGYPYDPWY